MILLGILSKREITRARIRVRSAMTVQTRDEEVRSLPKRRTPAPGQKPEAGASLPCPRNGTQGQ
ncbi:hypothetical protein [Streptomyces sp. NPDC058683]|uniref:hypothetical protein n=1 Tax=Streptomyces sp. NPDC058683 TaxID=3346597 RepID=UPI00366056CD